MNIETTIKILLATIFIILSSVALQLVSATNDCENAGSNFIEQMQQSPYSNETKQAEEKMQNICKAADIKAKAYMSLLTHK